MIHASIPAIKLEKPFVAREVHSINKLMEAVDSPDYLRMISENTNLFLPEICESINRQNDNYYANKMAVEEVKKILATLDEELPA